MSDSGGDGDWTWDGTNTYDGSFSGENYSSEGHSNSHYHGHATSDNTSGDGGTFTEAGSTGQSGSTANATYDWYCDGWSNGERTDTTNPGWTMPMWDGTQWVPHTVPPTVRTFESEGETHDTYYYEDHSTGWGLYNPQGWSSGSENHGLLDITWDRYMHVTWTVTGPWENSVTEMTPMDCSGTWHDTWSSSVASAFASGSTTPTGMSRSWSYTHTETDGGNPPTVTNSTSDSGSTSSGTPPTPPANAGQGGTWTAPASWQSGLNNLIDLTQDAYNNPTNVNQYVDDALTNMDTYADPANPNTPVMQALGAPTGGENNPDIFGGGQSGGHGASGSWDGPPDPARDPGGYFHSHTTPWYERLDPAAKKAIQELLDAARGFHVLWHPYEGHCGRWARLFIESQKDNPSPYYKLDLVGWTYNFYSWLPEWWRVGHAAVRVTLPDGTVFYLDDGWWGGIGELRPWGPFYPWDIPSWVHEGT